MLQWNQKLQQLLFLLIGFGLIYRGLEATCLFLDSLAGLMYSLTVWF